MTENKKTIEKVILILRNDLPTMKAIGSIKQAMMGMSNLLATKASVGEDIKYNKIMDSEDIIILNDTLETITSLYSNDKFKKLVRCSQLINDYSYPFYLKSDVAELLQDLDECIDSENCVDVKWDTYNDTNGMVKCTRLETTGMIIHFMGEEEKFHDLLDIIFGED